MEQFSNILNLIEDNLYCGLKSKEVRFYWEDEYKNSFCYACFKIKNNAIILQAYRKTPKEYIGSELKTNIKKIK